MRFELAKPTDDAELRRLLRENPMTGAIRLSFEREPCAFLAASLQGAAHQTIVARHEATGRLLGSGSRSVADAWINGTIAPLGYLAQLRLDRGQRGNVRMLRRGYALLRELHDDRATPFYVTTIVEDNAPARRILEAGIEGLPTYRSLEPYVTLTFPVLARPRAAGVEVIRAAADDLDGVIELLKSWGRRHQLAPAWSRESLSSPVSARGLHLRDFLLARRQGRAVGCAAVWDQRGFKQAVVQGYGGALRWLRPLTNLASPMLRTAPLPEVGQPLRSAFLSHLALEEDDPQVAVALVAGALGLAREKALDYVHLGLAARHPLLPAMARALPHRRLVSGIYLVHWEDGAAAAEALDGRVPHLEAALL